MAPPVTNSFVPTLTTVQSVEQPTTTLENVRETRGNINELRILLRGNPEHCCHLFRQALEEHDHVSQIQLAQALYGIKTGNDSMKDFSELEARDLEDFVFYPHNFALYRLAYLDTFKSELGLDDEDNILAQKNAGSIAGEQAEHAFTYTAGQDYLPAILELEYKKAYPSINTQEFALQLKPHVDRGDKFIDYFYGKALKLDSEKGSELFYKGLFYMNKSELPFVKYPKRGEDFETFVSHYIRKVERESGYFKHDGCYHFSCGIVLAPSEEAWNQLVTEKLAIFY